MFTIMLRFIKRSLLVILALIISGIVGIVGYLNSEKFATTMVSLRCSYKSADTPEMFREYRDAYGVTAHAQLRQDFLKDIIYLNFIDENAKSENGLQPTLKLKKTVNFYYGEEYVSYEKRINRFFNRETLEYTREMKNQSGEIVTWLKADCFRIENSQFERLRAKFANKTKAKQKI